MGKDEGSQSLQPLKIRKFDISTMAFDSTICCVGKRRTGKSMLVRDIMYHFRHIPKGCVFSGTEHCSPFFRNFVPDMYISKEYDSDALEKIFEKQDAIINRDGGKTERNNIFLVMDDMLADSANWKKDRQIRELLMNGRHRNIFFILTMQYPLGIPPDLRTNLDYVFIFRENILANRKRIWENFAGIIPKFSIFVSILEQCTEDYTCLVINNNSQSNKLEDIVFWYKAEPDLPKFRCGSKSFWRLHDQYYKDEKDEAEQDIDTASTILKQYGAGKGPNIRVVLRR
jgi:hypothetical protein